MARQRPIYERTPNQFLVRIRRKGPDGKSVTINRTFESYDDAEAWHDLTVGRISGHEFVDKSKEQRATLRQLLQRYLTDVSPTKKGHSQEAYRLRQWMAEPLADWALPAVTSSDIAQWRRDREAEGKAPSTIGNAMNLLSAVYKIAISEWGYRVENPVRGVARPKARAARWATLSADDEARLLAACANGPQWLIWCTRLALATGMRAGEIRGLRWEHIHDTHIHLPETKNGTSRDVPLTTAGLTVIREMRAALPRRLDGWVFGDPDLPVADGGFTGDALSQAFRDAAKKAEVSVTYHDLRHIAVTRLAPIHRDPLELAATTGHKTLNVLKRYYNPTPEDRAAELRRREAEQARKSSRQARMKRDN